MSMHYPKLQTFVEMFRTNLYSPVCSRHIGIHSSLNRNISDIKLPSWSKEQTTVPSTERMDCKYKKNVNVYIGGAPSYSDSYIVHAVVYRHSTQTSKTKHNMIKNPNLQEADQFAFTSMVKELNLGVQRNKSGQSSERASNLRPLDCVLLTTWPHCLQRNLPCIKGN